MKCLLPMSPVLGRSSLEDELLVMLSGAAVLVEDGGRTLLGPGDVCAWPAGKPDGHHLINESDADCVFAGEERGGGYADIDMCWTADGAYRHKDGTPYEAGRLK